MPAAVAMNTHFSHISCRISSLSRASKPALSIAEAMVSIRGEREPSSSPKLSACQSLRWTMAPSASRVAEMAHCPPSTRSAPKRSASRSSAACRSTAAESPSPGRPPWRMTPSRRPGRRLCSSAARGRTAPSTPSCSTIGGEGRWKSPRRLRIVNPCFASSAARRGRTRNVTSRPACSRRPPK